MATSTDLVNVALRRIGGARINSLENTTSKDAVVARDIYDEARKDCLNLHTWNFAIKRALLTVSSTTPTFGFDYAYPLPEDFIRMVSVHPFNDDDASVAYRLEFQDGDDRVLLTDTNTPYIRYVFDLQDVNVMSAAFRDVLAFRLAREFAAALGKTAALADLSDKAFRRKIAQAKSIDGVEDFSEKMADGSWITERHPDTSW